MSASQPVSPLTLLLLCSAGEPARAPPRLPHYERDQVPITGGLWKVRGWGRCHQEDQDGVQGEFKKKY